jgi:hypothetical protein
MARATKPGNSNSNGSALGFEATLWATDGELQFTLPDVLKAPPNSRQHNVAEIIGKFGGADQLRNAVNQLQSLLYAA